MIAAATSWNGKNDYHDQGYSSTREKRTYTEIPGIDEKRIFHVFADTHELAENARILSNGILCDHELHARGVHPISERCDDRKIGDA